MLKQHLQELQQHATPFYAYNLDLLRQTLNSARTEASKYKYHVHYALKANANAPVLAEMLHAGFGADCVSGNEVKRAIESGFKPENVVFAGVGKSDAEINYALDQDIFCFNCESKHELEILNELAEAKGKTARIALRINPNVNANTHKYITTGLEENKFGINAWELESVLDLLKTLPNIELIGIHFHIGSQITDLTVFKNLCTRVNEFQEWFVSRNITLKHINVGGGLGVDYYNPDANLVPDFEAYFALFNQFLEVRPGQEVHFELGRSLVAQCGTLISKVLYIKKGITTNFAILDAGMTELIRPALYQSYHKIENLTSDKAEERYDVVGPICESSDCFGKAVMLPETNRGDLVAIRTAGAYGEVMASGYNLREKAEAIYL
ncbi:diaminopimelate decarboxylase [Pontibacter sp. BT310]|uniref:Diaminopimelate decarboxylase n=1 Tax=Pontibacter populi TaxID=890055 RepID=A0ABS6XBS8_9BACT|nr:MULTISPECIES: diaminopimelate decarboxylase [Pontibacter]MBJ6118592.1 diaminopimelate decarboxylase [Pontibacter sp. BT310]MBR0571021.1 diaminopimelate decarboxylase [Microvirga sp. STS03]MBW3365446.1 diaminopimelate decarboxylase [Pontibacter populi]